LTCKHADSRAPTRRGGGGSSEHEERRGGQGPPQDPGHRRWVRRSLHGAPHPQEAPQGRGAGHCRGPAFLHDVPAVPPRGRGRLPFAPARRRPAASVLKGAEVLTARVTDVDQDRKVATIEPIAGDPYEIEFDQLVVAVGSIARTLPIPGLAENGIGFKTIEEAISLRNHVIGQLDIAASTKDEKVRRRALTFVFVGGGFAGVEAIAELEDMARDACKIYPNVSPEDMRWVMVEGSGRILPEVRPALGEYTVRELEKRGIQVT